MCGLAGYINLTNQSLIDETLLKKMCQSLVHRGPDGQGTWQSQEHQIGLAHTRLSIIDLSEAGIQPMFNHDKSVVICFNGEIYNYKELRNELSTLGHVFTTQTDTETIIHGYEAWGIKVLEKLEGMFAIVLFDKRHNELFLARDHIGIKPLYFSIHDGILSFASEIKALWDLPWNQRNQKSIWQEAYYHYLTFMVTPAPYTIFKNVYKLPAGFYAKINSSRQLSFCEWYSPIKELSKQEQKDICDENYCIEKIRDLLRQSTKQQMISDVPFGAFLSGGIDSSLNVALMAHEIGKVKTFTVAFENDPNNELAWARIIAKKFDTDHHEIIISEQDAYDFYEKMLYHLDEPLADCVCIPFYYVAKLAKDRGVTVVQVGEGSDELFFGYDIYAQYLNLYKRFWNPTNNIMPKILKKLLYKSTSRLLPDKTAMLDTLHKWSKNQNLFWGGAIAFSEKQKEAFFNKNNIIIETKRFDPIVEQIYPGLQRENKAFDSHDIVDYHIKKLKTIDPNASFLKQMAYLEFKQRLPELLLMRADKMSMAASVEGRVPFLNHKLVEFAFNIPDALKFKNNTTKYILKKACEGIIPNEIIYRKKVGFAAPIVDWFNTGQFTGPFAEDFKKTNLDIDSKSNNTYNTSVRKWVVLSEKKCA